MAAAKSKSKSNTRSKSTRRNTKTKTQAARNDTNLVRVCLLLSCVALSIIALFQFGVVGKIIFHLISLFIGNLTILFLLMVTLFCVLDLFRFDFRKINTRYWTAILLAMIGWLLLQGLHELTQGQSWSALQSIMSDLFAYIRGVNVTRCGLLGALIVGMLHSLFDSTGCYVILIFLFLIAIFLFGYDHMVQAIRNRQSSSKEKPKQAKVAPKRKNKHQQTDSTDPSSIFLDIDPEMTLPEVEPEVLEPAYHTVMDTKEEEDFDDGSKPIQSEPAEYIANEEEAYANYRLPRLTILNDILKRSKKNNVNSQAAKIQGQKLISILHEFGVEATLVQVHIGPSVTKFEVRPETGVRVNKISNLQYDIKMALAAKDIRIEAPIPGKNAVGIEIPNVEKTEVQIKELLCNIPKSMNEKKLLFCLGKDLMGNSVYGELDKMPHLLIAGATGSGKSVCVNSIISSFLMRTRPEEVKLVLIDPKKVEFTPYNDVPHLLAPVITDGDLANKALKVIVNIMEHRYDLFGRLGVRNIQSYNEQVLNHPGESLRPLPRIVIIIDELADLMLVAAKEVESSIQRITQLARAAGIHLIVATQRPSVDVITGVIKANIPSRIAFAVSSATDSRTILDQAGAERLLGYGDMLYLPNGESTPKRIQGVFVHDEEVNRIAQYVKSQACPHYDDAFIQLKDLQNQGGEVSGECLDPLYEQVKSFVIQSRRASTSLIQRKFSVGYSRAARLIDALEEQGIIGPANGSKPRAILVKNTLEDSDEE